MIDWLFCQVDKQPTKLMWCCRWVFPNTGPVKRNCLSFSGLCVCFSSVLSAHCWWQQLRCESGLPKICKPYPSPHIISSPFLSCSVIINEWLLKQEKDDWMWQESSRVNVSCCLGLVPYWQLIRRLLLSSWLMSVQSCTAPCQALICHTGPDAGAYFVTTFVTSQLSPPSGLHSWPRLFSSWMLGCEYVIH